MKRFVGLSIATAAIVLPVTPAFAASSPTPADYRPECEQVYQGGKAIFDPLIASPLKPVLNAIEVGLCGGANHTA